MGQRDAGVGEAADPDVIRNDPERDACRGQGERLLATTPEHERIAALETQHAQAGERQLDQALVYLSCAGPARPARLPTGSKRAAGPASARISGATKASCRTTSASASAWAACSVSSPGSPGPAPTSHTLPGANSG